MIRISLNQSEGRILLGKKDLQPGLCSCYSRFVDRYDSVYSELSVYLILYVMFILQPGLVIGNLFYDNTLNGLSTVI